MRVFTFLGVLRVAVGLLLFSGTARADATISLNGDGSIDVQIPGLTFKRVVVEGGSDLATWEQITNTTPAGETISFIDPARPSEATRFYRFYEPPFQAPQAVRHLNVSLTYSVIGAINYIVDFNGTSSGTFREQYENEPSLYGTFTYAPNGLSAHLLMNYEGPFAGDYDDMTLNFAEPPASGTLSGTQKVGAEIGPMQGTFTYE
jgi:hypothetical protein